MGATAEKIHNHKHTYIDALIHNLENMSVGISSHVANTHTLFVLSIVPKISFSKVSEKLCDALLSSISSTYRKMRILLDE